MNSQPKYTQDMMLFWGALLLSIAKAEKNEESQLALFCKAVTGENLEVLEERACKHFIKEGANQHYKDENGKTSLDYARQNDKKLLIALLQPKSTTTFRNPFLQLEPSPFEMEMYQSYLGRVFKVYASSIDNNGNPDVNAFKKKIKEERQKGWNSKFLDYVKTHNLNEFTLKLQENNQHKNLPPPIVELCKVDIKNRNFSGCLFNSVKKDDPIDIDVIWMAINGFFEKNKHQETFSKTLKPLTDVLQKQKDPK